MRRSLSSRPRDWSGVAVLTALAGLIVVRAANGGSLPHMVAGLTFLGGVLMIAWLWQWTCRRGASRPRLTGAERVWNAAVFVAWLVLMGALAGWYRADPKAADRVAGTTAATSPTDADPSD
jgi:hypothetical protein